MRREGRPDAAGKRTEPARNEPEHEHQRQASWIALARREVDRGRRDNPLRVSERLSLGRPRTPQATEQEAAEEELMDKRERDHTRYGDPDSLRARRRFQELADQLELARVVREAL